MQLEVTQFIDTLVTILVLQFCLIIKNLKMTRATNEFYRNTDSCSH